MNVRRVAQCGRCLDHATRVELEAQGVDTSEHDADWCRGYAKAVRIHAAREDQHRQMPIH